MFGPVAVTDPVLDDQRFAARWLADAECRYLADDMRVGKTPSAIRAADLIGARKILWLTTGAARLNHLFQWDAYSPLSHPCRIVETGKDDVLDRGVTITSYDLAGRALYDRIMRHQFDLLVLDEAHRLRTRTARRTRAVFGEDCDRSDGIASRAERVFCLSGTPAPNHPGELWTIIRSLFPDAIMRDKPASPMPYSIFEDRYCKKRYNGFGFQIVGARNKKDLAQRIAPYFLRRMFRDVFPDAAMVDLQSLPVACDKSLDALVALETDVEVAKVAERLNLAANDDQIAAVMDDVDQTVARRIRRLTGLAKVAGVTQFTTELIEDGRKVVLMAHHKEVLDALALALAPAHPVRLSGNVTPRRKALAEHTFRTNKSCKVFLGNIVAAGEAIDLSVADDVIMVEASWVPGENAQAVKRIVNLKKSKSTQLIAWFATLAGSIDVTIQQTNIRKTNDVRDLFNTVVAKRE